MVQQSFGRLEESEVSLVQPHQSLEDGDESADQQQTESNSSPLSVPGRQIIHTSTGTQVTIEHVKKYRADCGSEKIFWRYTRSILYFNIWYGPFRMMAYFIIGLLRLITCGWRKAKEAGCEVLSSGVVCIAGLTAVYVIHNFIKIPSCYAEVILEFVVGGLTLQICMTIGDTLLDSLCCTQKVYCHKLLENILEPIIFLGGFYSIGVYFKTKESQHKHKAKYNALGNIVGSSIAYFIATYLCHYIEDSAAEKERDIQERNAVMAGDPWTSNYKKMYGKENAILGLNVLARIFSDLIAKLIEYKFVNKASNRGEELDGTIITISTGHGTPSTVRIPIN